MADKPKKPKNLNDLLEQLRKESSSNLDESFKAHDAFTKDEYQDHLYNNIFVPAQHELYKGVKEELENVLGDDDTKLEHKNKELKKVVGKGLRKYFEKVMPGVIKAADALGMTEEQQYEHFSSLYDEHTAAGTQMGQRLGVKSISDLVDLAKDKKATVGKLKKSLYEMQEKHVQGALVQVVRGGVADFRPYNSRARYCSASSTCASRMSASPARSAMVRASLSTR